MKYNKFGSTDLLVSSIGFGTWPIGGVMKSGDYGAIDLDESIRAIRYALDHGVTLFDAAPAYGNGFAEEVLGNALKGRRDSAVISTKCGIYFDAEKDLWIRDSNEKSIIRSAEQSLKRLQTDYIDIFLIHWPDQDTPPESAMAGLLELQKTGKVKYIGVSNFNIDQIDLYQEFGVLQAQQVGYNLFDRRIEEKMLGKCASSGIGVMGYGSLCHGLLTGAWEPDITFPEGDWRAQGDIFGLDLFTKKNLPVNVNVTKELKKFAEGRGFTLPQLSLAWVMRNPLISVALTGMVTVQEVKENIDAVKLVLSDQDILLIDAIMSKAAGTVQLHSYDFNSPKKD